MRIEDLKSWTVDQLKEEVVRLSDECEKRQRENLDLKEDLDRATKKIWRDELASRLSIKGKFQPGTKLYDERHQSDCITINQLQTALDVIIDRYANLRKIHGVS